MTIECVDDARRAAARRLPAAVRDFVERGSGAELTLRRNAAAYADLRLRSRVAEAQFAPSTEVAVLGSTFSMPVGLAPVGFTRLVHPGGEGQAARAAARAGVPVCVGSLSGTSVEEVAGSGAEVWFQLYLTGARDRATAAMERADAAGCAALIVTVDFAGPAVAERPRPAAALPRRLGRRTLLGARSALRPRWLAAHLRTGATARVPNVGSGDVPLQDALRDISVRLPSWADVEWVRDRWPGPLVVKGVLDAVDARRAVDAGADAVVVSNHGGRALDGVPASVEVLPEIAATVGTDVDVLVDGGIRTGSDLAKAIASGAGMGLIGRPWLWGLAAGGGDGVAAVLESLRRQLVQVMGAIGRGSVDAIGPHCLVPRGPARAGVGA